MLGDVAARIQTVTVRPSPFPTSQARITIGRPHSLLSHRERYGVSIVCRGRCLLWTGKLMGHERAEPKRHFRLFTLTAFTTDSDIFTIPAI
ncbi:hypothetical protein GCM10026986_17170 [Nitrincola alkalisediminis]